MVCIITRIFISLGKRCRTTVLGVERDLYTILTGLSALAGITSVYLPISHNNNETEVEEAGVGCYQKNLSACIYLHSKLI